MARTSIYRLGAFDGHVVIVTGGGSGIGLAISELLGSLGARVAICGRKAERLDAAKKILAERGVSEVFAQTCDIREPEQIDAFVDATKAAFGAPTILVNNAGGQFPTTAEQVSRKGWEAVIRNNLNGTFFMTQAVANRAFIPEQRGTIVNIIANIARGFPGMIHTGAARAGVENMTKTLSVEWAQHKIRVNAIAPGIIRSSGTEQYPPELVEMSRQRTPMKRVGTPEEVADLVGYLASDAADYVTGETWYIDGGAHLWGDTWFIPEPGEGAPDLPGVS